MSVNDLIYVGNVVELKAKPSIVEGVFFKYQPIFDVVKHKPVAYEALVRSRHLSTENYLDSLISSQDRAVFWNHLLMTAIGQLKSSNSLEKISINCSQTDVVEPWFLSSVFEALTTFDVSPSKLIIELTEHFGATEHQKTNDVLKSIADTGVQIVLDDFGIKHCNLDALCFMPIQGIKIDGKFIRSLENVRCRNAVDYLVRFAKSIDVKVVVEHVESRHQVRQLTALGVRYMQGFYFSEGENEISGQELITKIYGEKISDSRLNKKAITKAAGLQRKVQ